MTGKVTIFSLICTIIIGYIVFPLINGAEKLHPPTCQASPLNSTVISAKKEDPYYTLAQEIAYKENLLLVHTLEDALVQEPTFLLWVISPANLSDQVVIDFSLTLKERNLGISVGLISGATLESARNLWLRASEAKGEQLVTANAANPAAHTKGRITIYDKGETIVQPITKANLQQALQRGDYLTFTGHGGISYLRIDKNTVLRPDDIPSLPPIVVTAASCNTFRIWEKNSIALVFTDKGAAVYAGFTYSPNDGYVIGEYNGLPLRYTWPDFPIGHVVMVQNKGTLKGFAHIPFYFLLGDPRISFLDETPYRLVDDHERGNSRILSFANAPEGFIPVRIPGGARYRFVKIQGITASWDREPFFNSHLQMIDIREDKYLLFAHKGGDFTLHLRLHPPWYWIAIDILLDSFDYTLIFLQQTGWEVISLVINSMALLVVIWIFWVKQASRKSLALSALIGMGAVALHGIYTLVRLDTITIIAKPIEFKPLSLLSIFILVSSGAFIFLHVKSKVAKTIALLLATFPALAPTLFLLGGLIVMNTLFLKPRLGTGLYNYSLGILSLITFVIEFPFFWLIFSILKKKHQKLKSI